MYQLIWHLIAARTKKVLGTPQQQASPEHRSASRRAGVSQSQRKRFLACVPVKICKCLDLCVSAASRSTSPSSRSNYGTYSAYRQTGTIPKKKSGIPRSLANSRETSPTRSVFLFVLTLNRIAFFDQKINMFGSLFPFLSLSLSLTFSLCHSLQFFRLHSLISQHIFSLLEICLSFSFTFTWLVGLGKWVSLILSCLHYRFFPSTKKTASWIAQT